MKWCVFILLIALVGCSSTDQTDFATVKPQLISTAPFPPYPAVPPASKMKMSFLIYVQEDGSVGRSKLLTASGDARWDSLAVESIMRWRFNPAKRDGTPVGLWVRQEVDIQFREPVPMLLGRMASRNQRQADSLYTLLMNGSDFVALASLFPSHSAAGDGDMLGPVDIAPLPPRVRDVLKDLKEGEVTRPMQVGDEFIIYKKLGK